MGILALDLGTKTGWAAEVAGTVLSGTEDFSPKRYDSQAMRYIRFQKWLDEIHETVDVQHIAYEEVRRHVGTQAAHVYGGLMAHLLTWCQVRDIPAEAYPVGTIKKFWAGAGNASKDAMILAARERGFDPRDDNEADALAILHMMLGGEG